MKCLPASKVPQAQGNVLHDWHAEVLAIRAFNCFVLDECKALLQGQPSEFLRWRTRDEIAAAAANARGQEEGGGRWNAQPFTWKEESRLHMYCSEAPCGDASMELIMASQEDATPWDVPALTTAANITPDLLNTSTAPKTDTAALEPALPGRAYFSHLGVVRRKPARSDAPPTLSKSCSDKLALKQCTSLLSSAVTLLVDPRRVYLDTLVLPASRYSEVACRRAFSAEGRMSSLSASREGGKREITSSYAFRPFAVKTTTSEFSFSQRAVSLTATPTAAAGSIAPSNLAAAWTRSGLEETSLGGTLQGRKQFDPRGASFASRRKTWAVAAEVAGLLRELQEVEQDRDAQREGEGSKGSEGEDKDKQASCLAAAAAAEKIQGALNVETYGEMKNSILLAPRKGIKEEAGRKALQGWARNIGDESFTL